MLKLLTALLQCTRMQKMSKKEQGKLWCCLLFINSIRRHSNRLCQVGGSLFHCYYGKQHPRLYETIHRLELQAAWRSWRSKGVFLELLHSSIYRVIPFKVRCRLIVLIQITMFGCVKYHDGLQRDTNFQPSNYMTACQNGLFKRLFPTK